jgi:DNA-binding transcriptional regulator YhcF (GntR family)
MLKDLKFDQDPNKPKYLQIADCFISNISNGSIKKNDQLPSINEFSKEYKVSRDTVEKAYKVLKDKKVVAAKQGKGTYINSTALISKQKVLFLINKLSSYKLEMYSSFINNIGVKYHTDFEVYHCDESLFLTLLEKHINKYDYYIIMPHFKIENHQQSSFSRESINAIKGIPQEKLIMMDNDELKIDGEIIEIFQDFETDIFNALKKGREKINKYKKLFLTIPKDSNYSYLEKIKKGFIKFCVEQAIDFEISNKVSEGVRINKGDLYIIIDDDDLVNLVDITKARNLVLGTDLGIISFNETPLKRLLGIAVVSTNFWKMGETAASMIINNKKGKIINPFSFIDRTSF